MNVLMLLELAAAMDGDRVALGSRADGRSYAELLDLAARAGTLLGRDRQRPVLYADVASPALPVAFLGAAWAARPFAPLSYRLAADRLRALVEAQAPATLIGGAGLDGLDPAGFLEAVAASEPAASRWPEEVDLPALLLLTSGTTGVPKVAILRHGHLTAYVLDTVEPMSADPAEATLVSVPPYHVAGMVGLLSSLYAGRRIVQLPSFEPAAWVELVRAEQITHAMVVPTMLHRILPLPLIERALDLLPGVDFVNAYGLTETSSTVAVLGPANHRARRKLGSVGKPLPTVEVEVRRADAIPCAPGERGQVWVRGRQVSGEYAGTAAAGDGWFATGDGGRLDDDGYLFVEGRLDDVIVRGGENLSPGEIEDTLLAHPDIEDAAVFGVPDDQWGEVVAAAVVLRAGTGLTEDDVRTWVAARLRSSRAPAVVRFLPELPRTETGKVLRRELRATT